MECIAATTNPPVDPSLRTWKHPRGDTSRIQTVENTIPVTQYFRRNTNHNQEETVMATEKESFNCRANGTKNKLN